MTEEHPIALPTLVSLLICDQVIDDKLTNKKSAIGLFNAVLVPQMPATIHQIAIMASLTDITGRIQLQLRFVRDSDNEVLFQTHGPVEAPSPLATVDLVFTMQGVRIPAAGQYAYELHCGGEILSRRRFQVVVRQPQGQRPPEAPPSSPA